MWNFLEIFKFLSTHENLLNFQLVPEKATSLKNEGHFCHRLEHLVSKKLLYFVNFSFISKSILNNTCNIRNFVYTSPLPKETARKNAIFYSIWHFLKGNEREKISNSLNIELRIKFVLTIGQLIGNWAIRFKLFTITATTVMLWIIH